ncbi:MAG: hypothetical protein H6733_13445 [Alphaproteobacteria bacterium]|nr:hypothetical protein [Alphaproteobacteria bacterium]
MSRPHPALALVVAAAFTLRVQPVYSLDVWWHLSMGRAVLDAGARTVPEPVGLLGPSTYVDPEWLFDVLALGLFEAGGPAAIVLVTALAAALSALAVDALARAAGASADRAVVVTALVAAASSFRFLPRPQSLFLVLLPLVMALVLTFRSRTGPARWVALAGVWATVALWSQVHTSVVIAPVVVACMAWPGWTGARPLRAADVAWLAPVAAAPFLGAFGVGVVDQVLRHSDGDATRYITDMRPMAPIELALVTQPSILLLDALLLGTLGLAGWRRRAPPGGVVLAILGFALTSTANRFRAAWAILLAPWAATVAGADPLPRAVPWGAAGVVALLAVTQVPHLGLGVDRGMVAVDLVQAMEDHDVRGAVFDDYDVGGILGWRMAGRVRVLLDGRTPTHFDADDLYAWRRGVRDPEVFDTLDRAFGFAAVAIARDRPLCGALSGRGWVPVWSDARRVLFLRTGAAVPDACLPPVDPTPRQGDGGAGEIAAWDALLDAGRADDVVAAASAVVDRLGHEASPAVDLRLARACAMTGDAACVGSRAWRAALYGQPGALDLLAAVRDRLDDGPQRRTDALLATR